MFSTQLLFNAAVTGSVYALAAGGLALTYGFLRVLNFAHGQMMMAAVYLFFVFFATLGWGPVGAFFATVAIAGVAAVGIEKIFFRPFARFSFLLGLIASLTLGVMLENSVQMIFGASVKTLGVDTTPFPIFGIFATKIQLLIVAVAVILLGGLAWTIHSTGVGRRLRALRENAPAARALGINADRHRAGIFVTGVLLAVVGGVLIGFESNLQPTMGMSYTIKAFAAMVVGGLGNLWGTIAGAYLLGILENVGIGVPIFGETVASGYRDAFAFGVILLVLLFKPDGLFGKKFRKV